mmetsp:Transcript_19711/g.53171  ORF Transcript_19711/g.53171 Transcript_19711/m.53171 type:complete len:217 (-) Transcript_19711:778-1428(-)
MTMTEPFFTLPSSTALSMSSSQSKHSAVPSKLRPSLPVILATEPSGARLPKRIWRWPLSLMGLESGKITSWPALRSGRAAKLSAIVLPVTVGREPSMRPSAMRYFITAGVPPTWCRSSITYLPEGLRSAMKGTASDTSWKSESLTSSPTERPMAMRWSTALVEPPRAMTVTMALRNAPLVMMSEGQMLSMSRRFTAAPAASHSLIFSSEVAGLEEE